MAEIRKVGVVGLGAMGAGIAQLCVEAGVDTVGREITHGARREGTRRDRATSSRARSRRGSSNSPPATRPSGG